MRNGWSLVDLHSGRTSIRRADAWPRKARILDTLELGLRLRYEIRRELAPYLGVHWERALFETADLARARGDDASVVSAVAGLRIWR